MPTENLRIGVFVCDCGSNIAGAVDTEAVRDYADELARRRRRRREQVHLRRSRTAGDPEGHLRAQPQPGGRRLLLADLLRADFPAVHRGGRAQPLPAGDGQHPRALLVGDARRPRGRHAQGQGHCQGGRGPRPLALSPGRGADPGHACARWSSAAGWRASRPPWTWPTPATRSTWWRKSRPSAASWPNSTRSIPTSSAAYEFSAPR